MTNEKIAARHIYSALLSVFWRKHPDIDKIGDFFTEGVYSAYLSFLENSLNQVIPYIESFTCDLYSAEDIETFIDNYKKKDGLLLTNYSQFSRDIELVSQLIDDNSPRRNRKE